MTDLSDVEKEHLDALDPKLGSEISLENYEDHDRTHRLGFRV